MKKQNILKTVVLAVMAAFCFAGGVFAQDIVFVLPKTVKVTSSPVLVKGAVMDFDAKAVDITMVNLLDLVRKKTDESAKEKDKTKKKTGKKEETNWLSTLDFEETPVINGFFQKSFAIKEGISAILAKMPEEEALPGKTSMKVIVLDKASEKIEIIEPLDDRVGKLKSISGKILQKPYPDNVKITVEALIADAAGHGSYQMVELLQVLVPVKKKEFVLPVNLSEMITGNEILLITISDNGEKITKTLF